MTPKETRALKVLQPFVKLGAKRPLVSVVLREFGFDPFQRLAVLNRLYPRAPRSPQ